MKRKIRALMQRYSALESAARPNCKARSNFNRGFSVGQCDMCEDAQTQLQMLIDSIPTRRRSLP